jgi:hypothetical protein
MRKPTKASASVAEEAIVLYDELIKSRDRLASLPPLTRHDLQSVALAMNEVIWFFLTPPKGKRTELALSEREKAELVRAARNRSNDLFATAVACLAVKLSAPYVRLTPASIIDGLNDYLDGLTFDLRATKKATLGYLLRARKEIDARIKYVRVDRPKAFQFAQPPEKYSERKNRAEKPDQFFRRVYAAEVRRGLTQADLRRADPAFYNVLHVWCVRHKRLMSGLIPTSRPRAYRA